MAYIRLFSLLNVYKAFAYFSSSSHGIWEEYKSNQMSYQISVRADHTRGKTLLLAAQKHQNNIFSILFMRSPCVNSS